MVDLFCKEYVLVGVDTDGMTIKLKEEQTKQQIIIKGVPEDSIFIKLDVARREYKQRSFYLRRGMEFIHKGCDYCLICPSINKVFFFELKSKSVKNFAEQFLASELFMEYCFCLWMYYSNSESFFYEKVYVLFSEDHKYQPASTEAVLKLDKVLEKRCNKKMTILCLGTHPKIHFNKLCR